MADLLRILLSEKQNNKNDWIISLAKEEKINLVSNCFRCICIMHNKRISSIDEFRFYFENLAKKCNSFFHNKRIETIISINYSYGCDVLIIGDYSKDSLNKKCEDLLTYLCIEKYEDIVISVGKIVYTLYDINDSYETAKNYGLYKNENFEKNVVFYDDINDIYNISSQYNTSNFNEIIMNFNNGDLKEMKRLSIITAEKVRKLSPVRINTPYPTSIKRLFIELTVHILHIAADNGVDVDSLMNNSDPYAIIMSINGTPSIIDWFIKISEIMKKAIDNIQKTKEITTIDKSKEYIINHISDYRLCLDYVAKEVGLSSAYLSMLFKKENNIGFNEYITKIRIKEAVRLLLNTNMDTTDIATQIGFNSASYFYRIFKKYTNSTPTEYRLLNKKE